MPTPMRGLPTIGDAVRAAREARHMSVRELARASGVMLSTLVALEEGRPNPLASDLVKLARALGTQASVLIADAETRLREQEESEERRWRLRRCHDELEATLTLTLPDNRLVRLLVSRLFGRNADDD